MAAESLAGLGVRIVQVARDRVRGQSALQRLRQISPDILHTVHYADLASISETERIGLEIADSKPRVDLLINNAGAMFGSRQVTAEGLERTFALNHMSYFVLTSCLRQRLLESAPARIVNTASDAHSSAENDFDDLQSVRAYQGSLL